tara:strand:+ start:152 stop:979 length:828 start_codon:yes stop_codon:yes gene_type:complete
MALTKETTTLTISSNGTNHIGDYILIYGVSFNASAKPAYSETKYFVWWGVSDATAPSVSDATSVHVIISGGDTSDQVATATSNAINSLSDFTASVNSSVVTIINSYFGNVTASNVGTANAITVATTTSGTGSFISNVKYPENNAMYFIEGDKLAILSEVDSSGNQNTTARKSLKSIQEDLVEGLMIQYYAEPNSVTAITDSLDIDNALELSVVDYVKKCLYMDKAGKTADPNVMQASMAMATKHERNFKEAIQRYGVRKKDKTGGSRVVKVPNLV